MKHCRKDHFSSNLMIIVNMRFYMSFLMVVVVIWGSCVREFVIAEDYKNRCKDKIILDVTTPYPYPTHSPINISSSKVVKHAPNNLACTYIESIIPGKNTAILTNTGYRLQITLANDAQKISITGWVLNSTYVINLVEIYWSRNPNENAGSSVNGKTAPIFVRIINRNTKYDSFDEALLHRDGLFMMEFGVLVRKNQTNKQFPLFEKYLKQVLNAGHNVTAVKSELVDWLKPFVTIQHVSTMGYIYPGSYTNGKGIQYDCATIFSLADGMQPEISNEQFKIFTELKNHDGKFYESKLTTAELGDRPFYTWSL